MKRLAFVVAVLIAAVGAAPGAAAQTTTYHWGGSGDRDVTVLDSLSPSWDAALRLATTDWTKSNVVDLVVQPSKSTRAYREKCPAGVQAIRICNASYKATWAGLAQVWYDGDDHIAKAKARLNTRYVKTAHDMRAVACHELGHTLGLNHRDQNDDTSCLTPRLAEGESPDSADLTALELLHTHGEHAAQPAGSAHADEEMTIQRDGAYRLVTIKILPR